MSEIFQDTWQRVCGKNQIFSWFRYLCSYLGELCRASMGQDMHDGSLGHASTIETEP